MSKRTSQFTAAGPLVGSEVLPVSQLSTTVFKTGTTISAASTDNSYNDSANGFLTAGFAAGMAVNVVGFTGSVANNIHSGVIESVTAGKMIIASPEGDVLVTDAAGESVTITAWTSKRLPVNTISPIGRHMVPVMASGLTPRQTNGCAALAYLNGAADQPDVAYLAFDNTAVEYAEFSIAMPQSWDEGTVTFEPVWTHPATTVNFGVVWNLQAVAVSNDDPLAVSFGTAQTRIDTGGTTSDHYVGPMSSAITVAGTPAAGDTVFFRLYRDPVHASDNMAVDAFLLGVRLYITTNAAVD